MPNWPDECIKSLKKYLQDGLSCSEAALELWRDHHFHATRNAVIGKATRMGLERPPKAQGRKPRTRKPVERHVVKRIVRAPGSNTARIVESNEMEQIKSDLRPDDIPVKQRKTLMQLRENDCRWPYGDPGKPDFFFCGGVAETGCPYCAFHSRVAFTPITRARKPHIPLRGHDA